MDTIILSFLDNYLIFLECLKKDNFVKPTKSSLYSSTPALLPSAGGSFSNIDKANEKEYNYTYSEGNLIKSVEYDIKEASKTRVASIVYTYDDGELKKKRFVYGDNEEGSITFNSDGSTTTSSYTLDEVSFVTSSTTDDLGRKTTDSVKGITRTFTYHDGAIRNDNNVLSQNNVTEATGKYAPTTQLVDSITYSDGRTISYKYDNEERITHVTDSIDGKTIRYTYDELGQLTKEEKGTGVGDDFLCETVINTMEYDGYGNITSKNGNVYEYGEDAWNDLLVQVGTCEDNAIDYDKQGNPTSYLGHTLVWEKGRQLRSYDGYTYTYNANGIRTSKTVDGVKHTYILDGTRILKETWGTNTIIPLYDNEDNVCGISYNGTSYYFVKNLQGDVISLVVKTGMDEESRYVVAANYTYDAWGKCTVKDADGDVDTSSDFVGNINPYRYRGYYYDVETGLYYLQSRYYDAEVGRFINGDSAENLKLSINVIEYSLYTYCNNSINNYEIDGFFSLKGVFKAIKKYVSLGWGKISFKLPYKISVVFGLIVLLFRIIFTKADIKSIHKITDNKFATMIVAALPYGSAYLTSEIIAWLCNVGAVVAGMMAVLSFVMSCCTGAVFSIANTVFMFLLSYILPTVIAAVQMIYFGFKKKRGCVYTIKLLGGSSVSF